MQLFELTFWLSFFALVWIFGGFGLLVALVGLVRRRTVRKAEVAPKVSLIIAAYNEEQGIAAKIRNSLSLDYPAERLEIIVASDGSSDATERIVEELGASRVTLLKLPRRGKIFALDDAVRASSGEVLVFSDANTMYDPGAIRSLVRNFADPEVGGVCGNQKHLDVKAADSSGAGEGLYWKYDKWLKTMESRTGSIVSADGAIYAIRRDLYRRPPTAAVTDDFFISTRVVAKGFRLVFEGDALAYEPTTGAARTEFLRKVRIMNRGLNGVRLRARLLNPFHYGFYSIVLFSHKVLRRLAALFLILFFAASFALVREDVFYRAAALSQALFYCMAALGWLLRETRFGRMKALGTPFFFCLANAAAFVALLSFARGRRVERWQPSRREAPVS